MVEIKKIMKLIINTLLFSALLSAPLVFTHAAPRIEGLESNEEYTELINKEQKITAKQDSLGKRLAEVRAMFSQQPDKRREFGTEILRLESEIFDARNEAGDIASRINMIEQEFIIANMDKVADFGMPGDNAAEKADSTGTPSKQTAVSANLVANDFFRLKLSPEDYKALCAAQQKEEKIAGYIDTFVRNHNTAKSIETAYLATDTAVVADSLYARLQVVNRQNSAIADSISDNWSYVFDNKTYAYNYLLDRSNKMSELEDFGRKANEALTEENELKNSGVIPALANYMTQKQLIFDYEKSFASFLRIQPAVDSLTKAEKASADLRLRKVDPEERLFIDYDSIVIKSPAAYNASKPIPGLTVYPKGIIYRVWVGSYPRLQAVSIFRGVYPLGLVKEGGRFIYYAGSYRTLAETETAIERLKKAGFRNPQAAVWNYGEYMLLKDSAPDSGVQYRVVIENASLSPEVRSAIAAAAPGKEVVKVNNSFFIGAFASPMEAARASEAIRNAGKKISVKITEIGL